jgi:hypothetical protein
VGWRNIIEKMHMTATLTKWYEEHGRHEIVAGGKAVKLATQEHSLVLRVEDVNHAKQHDLDDLGIAKTAREEKLRARDEKLKQAENERMAKLYREQILKEKPAPADMVTMIAPAAPKPETAADKAEAVGSFGD